MARLYKVRANVSGKRITSRATYKTKRDAQIYANEVNRLHKGANARVVILK